MSEPRPDLADVLSGDLDAEGWAAAEERMRTDAAFRAEVERLGPIGEALVRLPAEAWEDIEPPALRAPSRKVTRLASWRSSRPAMAAVATAAAALVALAAFGLGRVTAGGDDAADGRVVDLPALEGAGSGTAEISADGDMMTVRLADLAPSASGEFYELWLLNSPEDLISVGSIRVPASGAVEVTLPVPLRPERYRFLDLSVEPADGDPAHSGQSVLRGQTA